jgi:uncharacterized protein YydD (DUF2326 family)
MIERVSSTLPSFKTIHFQNGLNLVISEKSEGATDRQTRNSSGKSSLIEIFHFLLGSKCNADSLFRRDSLASEEFALAFDLRGHRMVVSRSGSKPSRVVVDSAVHSWPVQPKLNKKTGDTEISNEDWKKLLGSQMFDIPHDIEPFGPSFRSMMSYFIRRESAGGFQDATLHGTHQQNWDCQVNLSYLLGLDWRIPLSLQNVRVQEKSLAVLKKEVKSGVLGQIMGSSGELRTRLTVAERQVDKLQKELSAFQVLPEYHELELEASQIAVQISRYANENTLDRERIELISQQLVGERSPVLPDIAQMYHEAQIVLPELVTRRLVDVQRFHAAVIRNRITHLHGEIQSAQDRIQERERQAEAMDSRRMEILNSLASHGALDQMNRLQEEWSRQHAEVEELRKKMKMARLLESQSNELTIERAKLHQRLSHDLDEREDLLNEAIVTFEEFSQRISDHEGSLVVAPTDNGPQFEIKVEGGESKGIRNMQIFCFDLTVAVLWARRRLGPGFLVHDSHLFDGMDSRQIGKAIEIGAKEANEQGFQYIVTMNSDVLKAAEFTTGFNVREFINPVSLSDANEIGGLFGARI